MTDGDRVATVSHAALRAVLLLLVVWVSAGARFNIRPPQPASASTFLLDAISRGEYARAERLARERIATLEREYPGDSLALVGARDFLLEALIRGGKAGQGQTLALAEANLDARKRTVGSSSTEVAVSFHNLGDVHFQRGEYEQAIAFHQNGLEARLRLAQPLDRDVADSRERLASAQMRTERYNLALENLEKARVIRAKHATEAPVQLATTLELMAWVHRYSGNYPAARAPLEQALATRRHLTPNHPALVTTIEVQGDLLMLEGDVASAADTWREALALAERTLGGEHPLISALERRLSMAANAVGNRAEGRRRLERALLIAERTRSECDPELIVLVNDTASSLMFDGEYVDARRQLARTLDLSQKCFGLNNSNTATVVFNLAALTTQMGDLAEAERLYERAIQAWSTRGPNDPYVAKGLDAQAEVFETSGDFVRARTLFERALVIRRTIRPDHPDVAWTLTNLARVLAVSGDVRQALNHLREATDIYRRSGTSIEPDHLARTVSLRGEIQARRGNIKEAREDFTEALALRKRMFGSEHPLAAESLLKVAMADFALGRHADALAAARQARQSGLDHVKFTVRYLPERRALAYASRTTQGLGLELSLATSAPSTATSQFLDAVVRSRSIVLDELGARAHALSDPRPEVAAVQARLNTARQRFANLMLRSLSADGASPDTTEMLNAARREREEAEQAFAEQSAVFRSQLARADIGLADVSGRLAPGHALVSFVRYDRTEIADAPRAPRGAPRTISIVPSYVAFVLRSGNPEPSIIPLGPATSIDALVTDWRRQMLREVAGSGNDARAPRPALGEQLRRRVWDPVHKHLAGMSRVFVVPDGALNVLPIGALPASNGGYIVEDRAVIHYLSAERDVVRPQGGPSQSAGLLAIGGPSFADASSFASLSGSKSSGPPAAPDSQSTVAVRDESQGTVRGAKTGCASFQSISFDALPASGMEVESIARLWDQIERSSELRQAQVLTGPLATEAAFKQLSSNRRILHLATHGFFLGDECDPVVPGTRAVGGLTSEPGAAGPQSSRRVVGPRENPLLLSGLALAGANRRAAASLSEEDGILTAEEVAALDLEGVEWAVLSACDTGLGPVAAGEGVLGLRRAFQVAGVRTVIMSLWAVEDSAAREWMEALYRARLVNRFDTADSVRQASLAVLHERRSQGQSDHPFYWASFVAAGDWR